MCAVCGECLFPSRFLPPTNSTSTPTPTTMRYACVSAWCCCECVGDGSLCVSPLHLPRFSLCGARVVCRMLSRSSRSGDFFLFVCLKSPRSAHITCFRTHSKTIQRQGSTQRARFSHPEEAAQPAPLESDPRSRSQRQEGVFFFLRVSHPTPQHESLPCCVPSFFRPFSHLLFFLFPFKFSTHSLFFFLFFLVLRSPFLFLFKQTRLLTQNKKKGKEGQARRDHQARCQVRQGVRA